MGISTWGIEREMSYLVTSKTQFKAKLDFSWPERRHSRHLFRISVKKRTCRLEEQVWRSDESNRLSWMWPGFDSSLNNLCGLTKLSTLLWEVLPLVLQFSLLIRNQHLMKCQFVCCDLAWLMVSLIGRPTVFGQIHWLLILIIAFATYNKLKHQEMSKFRHNTGLYANYKMAKLSHFSKSSAKKNSYKALFVATKN